VQDSNTNNFIKKFIVLRAASMNTIVFSDVAPCCLAVSLVVADTDMLIVPFLTYFVFGEIVIGIER
jgi:hypothetical protein